MILRSGRASPILIPLLALWSTAAACGGGGEEDGGSGDGDGDLAGDGDSMGGDGGEGDGDGDGDLAGDGDGDLPGDGDAMGGASGTGGDGLGGEATGAGGEPHPGTGGGDGTGGVEGDDGLDCPLEEYEKASCDSDLDCEDGQGCLRNVCIALCDETIADLEAGLAPGVTPWAHICGVRRSKQLTHVFDDDGCQRAYIYNVNVYRLTAEPNVDIGFGVRRAEIDPSRELGDQQIAGGTLAPTGEAQDWFATSKSLISPDGSTIVFEAYESVNSRTTVIRVDTETGALTIGPTFDRTSPLGSISAFLDNTHVLLAWDADPSVTTRVEWGVLSLDDDQITPLLVADTTLYPDQAVALPTRGALLVGQQPDTIFAIPWADVTAAVGGGTTLNLSTNGNVLTLSEPTHMMPVSDSIVGYSDQGSEVSYQAVDDFGPDMLGGEISAVTLANDPTYWGHVTGLGGKRVVLNLFQSVMVVDVP